MENLPDIIYIPKEGKDCFGNQTWYRDLPNGVPYVKATKINR